MTVRIEHGDCREIASTLGVTVDAIVCDPPYDLVAMTKRFGGNSPAAKSPDHQRFAKGFMGQQWDATGVAFDPETWRILGSVLRPGGFLLAFGGTRTYHRMATAIEDAGFVIQDCLMWLYGSGFPKRRDMLKPAYEPIVMAYKPGGARTLQVEECRVETAESLNGGAYAASPKEGRTSGMLHSGIGGGLLHNGIGDYLQPAGRWPANVLHDGSDEVCGGFPESDGQQYAVRGNEVRKHGVFEGLANPTAFSPRGDAGSASRFFYCAKAGPEDRFGSRHPTVKPVELIRYLVKLVCPPEGTFLDPFAGSGTAGVAALAEGRNAILIEREVGYVSDIQERMEWYRGEGRGTLDQKLNRQREVKPLGGLFSGIEDAAG